MISYVSEQSRFYNYVADQKILETKHQQQTQPAEIEKQGE